MNDPHLEEWAALCALNLQDEAGRRKLREAADRDEEVARLLRDFSETAALMAYEAPQVSPPAGLRREIMHRLPMPAGASAKIIRFPAWLPYAIAACLMVLGIVQTRQILDLKTQLLATSAEKDSLVRSNALLGLRLTALEAKDAAYAAAKIIVAWDPERNRGVVALQSLPAAPAGHDYQLWVLDPEAAAPVSAGLIAPATGSQGFAVRPVRTAGPGFAISLEPSGGRPEPTGPILFAVAPGS